MSLLLKKAGCDPNVLDFKEEFTLLSYAHKNKKSKAYEMLVKHNIEYSAINPNKPN